MKKILFLIALTPLSAQAWWFGNYDDCVLDNMKPGLSTAGVAAVKTACRNKYPLKKVEKKEEGGTNYFDKYKDKANTSSFDDYISNRCATINLTNEEIGNIKLQPDNYYYSIWNGNSFRVDDLVFTLNFKEKDYLGSVVSDNEVNKNAGSIDSETAKSTIYLNFPSNVYSYMIIKATKTVCK